MRIQILVDADEFWPSLLADLRSAKDYTYIQTLSFEGDRVGKALARELAAARAPDRRVISDEFYTKHRINDHYLHNPKNWFNQAIRQERDETLGMLDGLRAAGVGVRLTNPSGPFTLKFLDRNHKKIIAIDDRIAYIGGINFSEHNFAWHDMMLRIEDPEITVFLKEDFLATWRGEHANTSKKFPDIELIRFDGDTNRVAFQPLLDLIGSAKKSVYVESPYVSYPFIEALRRARGNGAEVTLITPEENNWRTMREYVIWEAERTGIRLRMFQGRMLHLKAMLIDDEFLIVGSSNFDFLSCQFMQEIVAVITSPEVIRRFRHQILDRDIENTVESRESIGYLRGLYHISRLKIMCALFHAVGKALPAGR